jgi:FG-GAP-like repeat/FG-GAP repeat
MARRARGTIAAALALVVTSALLPAGSSGASAAAPLAATLTTVRQASVAGVCPEVVSPAHVRWRTEAWVDEHVGQNRSSAPTLGDLDRDGVADVVWGDERGFVHARRADGRSLPGFPAPAVVAGGAGPTAIGSSPVVADLDRNGTVEIVVGVGTLAVPNQQGGLVVLDHLGRHRWSLRTGDVFGMWNGQGFPDGYSEGVWSSPAVGDVDGDGFADIVYGAWDHHVYAVDRNGTALRGFPYRHHDTVWSSPALYDVDGDGRVEIFIGADSTPNRGGQLLSLDWNGGAVSVRWVQTIREILQSSPVIADVDGDRRAEVVVGSGALFGGVDSQRVWMWHADDGSPQPGWPVTLAAPVTGSPALGDVNGDRRLDVVIGDRGRTLYALADNGATIWARDVSRRSAVDPGTGYWSSPAIADLDGDGRQDVLITGSYGTFAVRGRDGARLDPGPFTVDHPFAWLGGGSPVVADFGRFGWQAVVAGFDPARNCTRVVAYRLARPGVPAAWPMWRGHPTHRAAPAPTVPPLPPHMCRRSTNPPARPNAASAAGYWVLHGSGRVVAFGVAHLGDVAGRLPAGIRAVAITVTQTARGYWILDSRGEVYAFGDARDWGSMADRGARLVGPVISMAALPTGNGYWLLGSDGGVFSFGAARFRGSVPGVLPPGRLFPDAPVIAMVPTTSGGGYWLIGADGGMFSFGDATFRGSIPGVLRGRPLAAPIVSAAVHPAGSGYWMLGADGGVFSFAVPFLGSVPGLGLCAGVTTVELRPTRDGNGYYALGSDGGIFTFGNAYFRGASPSGDAADLAVRW